MNNIFQPSLQEGKVFTTRSYDIGKLFFVAFFAGLVPTMILGARNAKWLRLEQKTVNLLLGLGILALLAMIIITGNSISWDFSTEAMTPVRLKGEIRWLFRAFSLGLYLAFYLAMKSKYQQHLVTVGETEPLLKDGILWGLVGGVVEAIAILGGVFIIAGIL